MKRLPITFRSCLYLAVLYVLSISVLLSSCTAKTSVDSASAEFKAFLRIKKALPQHEKKAQAGGYAYKLAKGQLSITDGAGNVIWTSKDIWWVDDFCLGDISGEGNMEILFSLWKSYSFGNSPPERLENDDASVKNHLFLYTVRSGYAKPLWCSSNLPRPIYSFKLDPNGRKTPVSSGMLLYTEEGAYTGDFSETQTCSYTYTWEGWGFTESTHT
ncbi:MAG: hypothetical protein LBV68_08390 [Spirochaetaceae bacterium]|jgi:poly-gamma-glutamate synthesis protein (capsule biosynthesis protein)|nr:hypothetical protein [Spirochaetaceae bacterium]